MKFKFYIVIFCFLSVLGLAQKIVLNWDGVKEIDRGESGNSSYPFFSNYGHLTENNTVFASLNVKTNNQIDIDQLQWQELPSKDKGDISINYVSESPKISIAYFFNASENAQSANIIIETLKKENNKIYKDKGDISINYVSESPKISIAYFFNASENAQSANIIIETLKKENNKIY